MKILGIIYGIVIVSSLSFSLIDDKISVVEGLSRGIYVALSVGFGTTQFADSTSHVLAVLIKGCGAVGFAIIGNIIWTISKGWKSHMPGSVPS